MQNPTLPPQPVSKPSRRPLLLGVMVLLCLGAAGTIWLVTRTPAPGTVAGGGAGTTDATGAAAPENWVLPRLAPEAADTKRRAVVRAFTQPEPCKDPAQLRELSQLFWGLDRGAPAEGSAAGVQFDYERLYREALRHGVLTPAQIETAVAIRQDMLTRLQADGPEQLESQATVATFAHTTITAVTALEPAPGESAAVVVYVQRCDPGGGATKERWWVAKAATGWRLYDYENLYAGARYSQYLAWLLKDIEEKRTSPVAGLLLLKSYLERGTVDAGPAAAELTHVQPIASSAPELLALWQYARGLTQLLAGDAPGAQASAQAALKLQPDNCVARYLLGECHNRQGEFEAALQDAAAMTTELGRDPYAAELRATALLALDRTAELPTEFEIILDYKPTDTAALMSLRQNLPAGRKAEAYKRYEALVAAGDRSTRAEADGLFHNLAEAAIFEKDAAGLETLLAARKAGRIGSLSGAVTTPTADGPVAEAGDDLAVVYRVKWMQLQEQWPALRQYVAAALPAIQDGELRDLVRDMGLRAAAAQKQAVAAYKEAADPVAAFRVLCEALRAQNDADGLAELILAHHATHGDDIWIHFYAGVRSLMQEDFPRAEAHFAEAVKGAGKDDPKALFRNYWLSAAYHADHGIQAFTTSDDKKAAFAQLKRYYLEDGRDELLEMLLERYRPVAGDDPEFALALADIQFLSKQYQPAIDQLEAAREKILKGTPEQRFEFYDCMLRCLVRQKQFPFAEKELQGVEDPKQEAFLSAMVAAGEGKVDAAAAALRRCKQLGFPPEMIYGDVDLGTALRTPQMQAGIGKEFPLPTKP